MAAFNVIEFGHILKVLIMGVTGKQRPAHALFSEPGTPAQRIQSRKGRRFSPLYKQELYVILVVLITLISHL